MECNVQEKQTQELPCPKSVKCPYENEYFCDVLVVGCGYAGLNAAYVARQKGQSVLVVDKGKPGYSGLSPWAATFRWFEPSKDNADAMRKAVMIGGDYLSNLKWYNVWVNESKGIYERLTNWGILTQYPKASEAGDYYKNNDFLGYRQAFDKFDRHKKWIDVLNQNNIPYLERTMVVDVLTANGEVTGAIGLHVQSGKFIVFHAKAVVLATGGGCYKPTGYPVGGNTFDGEYIAFQLGLPIAGKEFEDFHGTSSVAAGNAFYDNHWAYLENIWFSGGDITAENADEYAIAKGYAMAVRRVNSVVKGIKPSDGTELFDSSKAAYTRRGASALYGLDPTEIRCGSVGDSSPVYDMPGGAVGLGSHLSCGVFCGMDDLWGSTAIAGLYVAGDGIHSTSPSGSSYPCGVGFASSFCSIDGSHAGMAAAEYASKVQLTTMDKNSVQEKVREECKPLLRETGIDPNWARDVLHSIMAPYWVNITKTEPLLNAALTQVGYMRDHVIPQLIARNGHDLRLCIEMKHKILSAEMKLRASLFRKESRGTCYRADYPYRDDAYLGYITVEKAVNEKMELSLVPIKPEWAGDKTLPYEKRYGYYFPGEIEAKGIEKPSGGAK